MVELRLRCHAHLSPGVFNCIWKPFGRFGRLSALSGFPSRLSDISGPINCSMSLEFPSFDPTRDPCPYGSDYSSEWLFY